MVQPAGAPFPRHSPHALLRQLLTESLLNDAISARMVIHLGACPSISGGRAAEGWGGMLRVQDVRVLRHRVLDEELSRRQVARELGISRNTVPRYLTLAEPVQVEREPRRKPVLERVQPRLDALLDEWSGCSTPKQRTSVPDASRCSIPARRHRRCPGGRDADSCR